MKRYYIILVALIAIQNRTFAQNRLGAELNIKELEYHDDSVNIDLEFDLEDLTIGANESVIFTPTMVKGDNKLELPTVVVRSRKSAISYNRAMTLGNTKSVESYNDWYGTPLQIVDLYGSDKQEQVAYNQTIEYQTWMVGAQLYVDCQSCGCSTIEDSGMIIPKDNTLSIDIPTIEEYNISPQVELIKPEKVAIKRRDIAYSSALIFKVNSTYIDPNLDKNRGELESIDEMMQSVISDPDYTITKVNIIGYASPEGSLESNMKLSKGRAAALEALMKREYKTIDPKLYNVEFGGENWDKLYQIVEESDIDHRDDVLNLIKNVSIDDGRELLLQRLNGGTTYKYLLKNIFPATRLVVVDVEYNIDAYDIERIGELIDTKPQNLSLEEMYRLSEIYNIDDAEFEKIFMTAVNIYPDDEVAQNNALVTEIRRGNTDSISDIAKQVDTATKSAELANSLGAYYMLLDDYDSATFMLKRAINLGSKRAEENLKQLTTKLENQNRIEEINEFRKKIYGEN